MICDIELLVNNDDGFVLYHDIEFKQPYSKTHNLATCFAVVRSSNAFGLLVWFTSLRTTWIARMRSGSCRCTGWEDSLLAKSFIIPVLKNHGETAKPWYSTVSFSTCLAVVLGSKFQNQGVLSTFTRTRWQCDSHLGCSCCQLIAFVNFWASAAQGGYFFRSSDHL